MSTDSVSYTASYLRGLKAEHDAKVLRDTITGVCSAVKDAVIESAKKGNTKLQFTVIPRHSECELKRLRERYKKEYENVSDISINNCMTGWSNTMCDNETFVGMCLTELEKIFPDCAIVGEGETASDQRLAGKYVYTVAIDWSTHSNDVQTEQSTNAAPTIESLQAEISALKAENAALKAQEAKKKDPFDLIELFTGFGAIQQP